MQLGEGGQGGNNLAIGGENLHEDTDLEDSERFWIGLRAINAGCQHHGTERSALALQKGFVVPRVWFLLLIDSSVMSKHMSQGRAC